MTLQKSKLLEFLASEGITLDHVLQVAKPRFVPPFFTRYFHTAKTGLLFTFDATIPHTSIEAMAAVCSPDSVPPVHAHEETEKLHGNIPTISVQRKCQGNKMRNILMEMSSEAIPSSERLQMVMANVAEDITYVRNSVLLQLDTQCKQILSTGRIYPNQTNNIQKPMFPEENMLKANADWDLATTDILKDLEAVREKSIHTGKPIAKVLIGETKWHKISMHKSLMDLLKSSHITLDNLNSFLNARRLPFFEIVQNIDIVGAEENGLNTWAQDNVTFVPDGYIGVIYNAPSDEQSFPNYGVDYVVSGGVTISRWGEKPLCEITEGCYHAIPVLEQAHYIFVLDTKG